MLLNCSKNKSIKQLMSFKAKKDSYPILKRRNWLVLLLTIFFIVKDIDGAKHAHQKRPATLTILSEDGDIVDCIDIYEQPALNHPLLKNHTIKMKPGFVPTMIGTNDSYNPVPQIWQKNGICPEGTIPIQRVRGKSVHLNGEFSECKVEVARLEMQKKWTIPKYSGASGTISAWNIHVEDNEWSLNSVTVFNDKNSFMETGWAASPILFGDKRPRVFVNWMATTKDKGCFNFRCSGFIQLSRGIMLGGALSNVSTIDGQRYDYKFTILKDESENIYWAMLQKEPIGYWPMILFEKSFDIRRVNWGGSVCNMWAHGEHTKTEMGSGAFSNYGYTQASYVRRIQMLLSRTEYMSPPSSYFAYNCIRCYRVQNCNDFLDVPDEECIYYGGPGGKDCDLPCK